MREMATTRSNSTASYCVLIAMLAGAFTFPLNHRARASGKLSERMETSLAALIDEFPNPTRRNLTGPKCQQSASHQLEYFCGAALRCSNVFVVLNDTRIFFIEHISGPEHCNEKNFFVQVHNVIRNFFDMDFEATTQITNEMQRGASIYSQGERNSELTNKDTAKSVKFGGGVGNLTVSYQSYPTEYVKRYRFRWDGIGK